MEPLGWDEIVSQPGMGGYLSFLNGPIPLPHLQAPGPQPTPVPVVVSGPVVVRDPDVVIAPDVVSAPAIESTPAIEPSPVVASSPVSASSSALDTTPQVGPVPGFHRTPGAVSDPVLQLLPGDAPTAVRRPRIRRCAAAYDGHSLGEEVLYQALWKAAAAESAGARTIVIGWRGMSQLCRMTPKNCKINTQRLIRKLALEVLSPYNTPESIGTTYRIFPSEAILRRRRAAGLEWVVRSRGVEFVDPSTGIPVSAHLCGYISEEASPL
jgi:hypothetical protein